MAAEFADAQDFGDSVANKWKIEEPEGGRLAFEPSRLCARKKAQKRGTVPLCGRAMFPVGTCWKRVGRMRMAAMDCSLSDCL